MFSGPTSWLFYILAIVLLLSCIDYRVMIWFVSAKFIAFWTIFILWSLYLLLHLLGTDIKKVVEPYEMKVVWGSCIFAYTCSTLGAIYLWIKERDVK